MNRLHPFFWFALILVLAGCATAPAEAPETLPLEACQLPGGLDAQCGTLLVPENRAAPNGRSLSLRIAVIPAGSSVSAPDPVFLLAGGPGQAASAVYPLLLGALGEIRQEHDVVLVDQRGTGQSGGLACPALDDLPLDATEAAVAAAVDQCRARLAETADLTQYTTDAAMADLDAVRAALGYEQINLIGTSYGTRAALAYLRLFPDRVRSLVLNAVAGPELVIQLQAPRDGERALALLFARCAADAACRQAFPNLEAEFDALLARFDGDADVTVSLIHPTTGEPVSFALGREQFMQNIFNLLYSAEIVSLLPLLIHQAHDTGDLGPILAQAIALANSVNLDLGMFYAVVCSEDAAGLDLAQAEQLQAGSRFPLAADDLLEACAGWPVTAVSPALRQPPNSDVPVLLLSGNADPITPPQYAEAVAAALPNSRHLVVPHYGHDVLAVGCIPTVVAAFLEAGSAAGLDTACLSEIQPPPFFVSPAGPLP